MNVYHLLKTIAEQAADEDPRLRSNLREFEALRASNLPHVVLYFMKLVYEQALFEVWLTFTSDCLGALWVERKIIYSGSVRWPDVVHEMGHTFAALNNPYDVDEYDFLGWEYRLVRSLRAPMHEWLTAMSDYRLGSSWAYRDLGTLSVAERRRLWKERVTVARAAGLLDERDNPRCIRD